ncbi:MAG: DUF2769 domain-containing protein [Thermoplasmata archaeon]
MPVDDTPENLNICMDYCGTCPSLPSPPFPFLYCARGGAGEAVKRKGCNCTQCGVYRKHNLEGDEPYYCRVGRAP